jgi:hypothetical protein
MENRVYGRASARSPLAPASIHRSASARMIRKSSLDDVAAPLKHHALCSFQIFHETNANSESIPTHLSPLNRPRSLLHQRRAVAADGGK